MPKHRKGSFSHHGPHGNAPREIRDGTQLGHGRHALPNDTSRQNFSKNAGTHRANMPNSMPMRGGIRL